MRARHFWDRVWIIGLTGCAFAYVGHAWWLHGWARADALGISLAYLSAANLISIRAKLS